MPQRSSGQIILKALLPMLLVLVLGLCGIVGWLLYSASHPQRRPYLVTPQQFAILSFRGLKITDELWRNADGTQARGWLLRGAEGAPAIIMLHRYGADRSSFLNLGVKLNETTNFTILWPDSRGHGENPLVGWTSFGPSEAEDVSAALNYLRTLKTAQGKALVGGRFGLFGVEMGSYAALTAAMRNTDVRSLVLDSVPATPDVLLRSAIRTRTGVENGLLQILAKGGAHIYFLGSYDNTASCNAAASLTNRSVLLLSGDDAGPLRDSTVALAQCFTNQTNVELKTNLAVTGLSLTTATSEQEESYGRRVIDFFDKTLR